MDLSSIEYNEDTQVDVIKPAYDEQPQEPKKDVDNYESNFGQDRRRQILLLKMYINEFPTQLSAYKDIDLESLRNDDLSNLKDEIDFLLGCKNTVQAGQQAFIQAVSVFEELTKNFTPLKTEGFTKACMTPQIMDDVKHVCIKRMDLIKTEPETRLAYGLITNLLLIHNLNSQNEQHTQIQNQSPPPNEINKINEQFSDL